MINHDLIEIKYSDLNQLYLSNSEPRYHEVENWYGHDQWLSKFRHHVFMTSSAIPLKFSTSITRGSELIWLWSVVINFPPSRIPNCISYTYQILNLGIMRLRIDMAMISGYQFSAITYSQLHQLYLSNSQPRYHEVENWYGYDQWLSTFRHHVFTTTSAIPITFSTSVSWGWELVWLWSVVINFPPSRIYSYISYTYQILNLGIMRLRMIWLWSVVINDLPSRIHDCISYSYQILNLGIMRLRIALAMINRYHVKIGTFVKNSKLHQP